MIAVGITGGIGSGKTTVARLWEEMGANVVFADDLAKEMMRTDEGLKESLVSAFGNETYTSDGELNKAHLIREAFHKNRVDELNAIVHPAIRRQTVSLMQQAREEGAEIFVYEAAILLNDGRPDYLNLVVIVTSDREKRLRRVAARDDVEEQEVIARMSKQPDFDSLIHLADYVIDNNGTIEELRLKASNLYRDLIGNH